MPNQSSTRQYYRTEMAKVILECRKNGTTNIVAIKRALRSHFGIMKHASAHAQFCFREEKKVQLQRYLSHSPMDVHYHKANFKLFKVTYTKDAFVSIEIVAAMSKSALFVDILEPSKNGKPIVAKRRKKSKYTRYHPSFVEAEKDVLASEFGSLRQTKIKLQHLRTVHCQTVLFF